MPPIPAPPEGLPADLVKIRPDVREAEEKLISANAAIGNKEAFRYPSFSLTGALGLQSRQLADIATKGATTWSLGAGITAPLFDGGKIDAQVDQAKARAKSAKSEWVNAVHTAFVEIADALGEAQDRGEAAQALDHRRKMMRDVLDLAQGRYKAGVSTYLEVLDAQRQVHEAELEWLYNRQAQLDASVALFKAFGGGWSDERAKPKILGQTWGKESKDGILPWIPPAE